MAVEYRPVTVEEMPRFVYASQIGFGNSTADVEVERALPLWRKELRPEWTLAAFEDGELAAQMGTAPFVMRWNGRDIGCGGVMGVSTLPSHRRRGHLRELMTRAFADMRANGQPVAMLWASMAAIYQRFGYGVAYTNYPCEFDPRHLRFVDEIATPGRMRLVMQAEARPLISDAHRRFAAPRALMLDRDQPLAEGDYWSVEVFGGWPPDAPPWLVAVYEEGDAVLGYTIYRVQATERVAPGPYQRLQVRDLVWLTPAAHRALIRYLAGYDLADTVQLRYVPEDDPLFLHVQEPRLLGQRATDGTLVRIVDVQAALEGRGYDADGRLTLALDDDMCPWNAGAWDLIVEGGHARLKPSGAAPALYLTPRALAILASGHRHATALATMGLLTAPDPAALTTADALFHTTYAPLCADGF